MELKQPHHWPKKSFFKPARFLFEKQADVDTDDEAMADTVKESKPFLTPAKPEIVEEAPVTERVPTYGDQLTNPLTAPDTERKKTTFDKPRIEGEVSGLREKVGTTLEDKNRRIAELEALLAAKDEEHKKALAEQEKKHQIELIEEREKGLIDTLTGLHNRRFFDERVEDLARLALRHGTSFSVLFVDLDRFKSINDTLGHDAGDEALRIVGEIIRETLRPEDEKFRYGGEELIVLLPETEEEGAKATAERLRLATEEQLRPRLRDYIRKRNSDKPEEVVLHEVALVDQLMGTASIGASTHKAEETESKTRGPESEGKAEKLAKTKTKEADEAAYQAKKRGRNNTVVYGKEFQETEANSNLTTFLAGKKERIDSAAVIVKRQAEELIPDPKELEKTLRMIADQIREEQKNAKKTN